MLSRAGVRSSSVALYPLRRRMPRARSQIDLRSGLSIIGPADEPLLFLFREIWVDRCYDPGRPALNGDGAIVDIGAHVGLFALWAVSEGADGPIVAIESSPRAAAYLRANVRRNGLRSVTVLEAACGGSRRRGLLYPGRAEMQSTLHPTSPMAARPNEVDVLTLEDVFKEHRIERCQLLKLDCEGAEYEILLRAGRAVLERVDRIVMEVHLDRPGCDPAELADHLSAHGFELRWSRADGIHAYVHANRLPRTLIPLEVAIEPAEEPVRA
ncbi:MAG: FkbM family methyltransferase [Elusimicrobia bacterium]|nr:FkbM family methyltransferase [Elusimicrobiota bacterium]